MADMATRLPSNRRSPSTRAELGRLHELIAAQHRRLRLVGEELGKADDAVAQEFPCRCAKPRVTKAVLDRLIEEARLRLELEDSSLGGVLAAAWPEAGPAVPVLRPSPGLAAYRLRGLPELPNLVVALFGLDVAQARQTVEQVLAEQSQGEPFAPVFLTDSTDFSLFRDQRLAFEYVPLICDGTAPPPDPRWAAYLVQALQLTMRRWGVRKIVVP